MMAQNSACATMLKIWSPFNSWHLRMVFRHRVIANKLQRVCSVVTYSFNGVAMTAQWWQVQSLGIQHVTTRIKADRGASFLGRVNNEHPNREAVPLRLVNKLDTIDNFLNNRILAKLYRTVVAHISFKLSSLRPCAWCNIISSGSTAVLTLS